MVPTERQWKPNMFPWHPQLRFFNMQSLEDRDEWWRVTTEDFACELDFAAAKASYVPSGFQPASCRRASTPTNRQG